MEGVIIAAITVVGTVLTSIISIWVRGKIRKNRARDDEAAVDLMDHPIFTLIDNIRDYEIKQSQFNNNRDHQLVQKFLEKRLILIKNNLGHLLSQPIETYSIDRSRRLISDFMHGLNGFNDINEPGTYNDLIDQSFLEKWTSMNSRTTVMILAYIGDIPVANTLELFSHFLTLYQSSLTSLIDDVFFNMRYLLGDTDTHTDTNIDHNEGTHNNNTHTHEENAKHKQQLNQHFQAQLEAIMANIKQNSDLDDHTSTVVEKYPHLKKENLLFYCNNHCEIIYCTEKCLWLLEVPIQTLIGSSMVALIQFDFLDSLELFFKNPRQIKKINIKLLDPQHIPRPVTIFYVATNIFLCFLL